MGAVYSSEEEEDEEGGQMELEQEQGKGKERNGMEKKEGQNQEVAETFKRNKNILNSEPATNKDRTMIEQGIVSVHHVVLYTHAATCRDFIIAFQFPVSEFLPQPVKEETELTPQHRTIKQSTPSTRAKPWPRS